eukprot:2910716-Prymnesium_polylepis.1
MVTEDSLPHPNVFFPPVPGACCAGQLLGPRSAGTWRSGARGGLPYGYGLHALANRSPSGGCLRARHICALRSRHSRVANEHLDSIAGYHVLRRCWRAAQLFARVAKRSGRAP